jgi:hypothetical protein
VSRDTDRIDQELAQSLVGKHILVGVTYVDSLDNVIEKKQMHGRILRINSSEGVVIALASSGDEFKLPPDLGSVQVAPPGEYRLRSTGEVVANPDLTATWVVKNPPKH